jgi:sortase A
VAVSAARHLGLDTARTIRVPWRRVLAVLGMAVAVLAGGFVTTNTYAVVWQQHLEGKWAGGAGTSAPAIGEPVAKLLIPSLGLEQVVVEGDELGALRKGPGHVPGSPLPGATAGNAVIRGHRLLWSGPFRDLHRVNYGSEIFVQTGEGVSVYLVTGVFQKELQDVDPYADTSLPYLTLVTSDPPWRADGLLVVRAVLVEKEGVEL